MSLEASPVPSAARSRVRLEAASQVKDVSAHAQSERVSSPLRSAHLRDGSAPGGDGGQLRQEPGRRRVRRASPSRSAGSAASWPTSSGRSTPTSSPWQTVQVSRHPQRPQTRDYIDLIFDQFVELHGDRAIGDDQAIVTGLAHLGDAKVMFIGHQKGKNLAERTACNFGCAHPEGYRKALVEDAAGGQVRPADHHLHRHAGRLSGHRRRGARPGR